LALLSAALLGACQTTSPGAAPSALGRADRALFKRLAVTPAAIARPSYTVVAGCSYRSAAGDADRYGNAPVDVSVIRARDRLLVRIAGGRTLSTALIGSDGSLFDFNLSGFGSPATPDTFAALARQRAAVLRPTRGADSHVVNDFALILPHYSALSIRPGDTVSSIADENGRPWARYVYRGLARYEGREVLVLDLLRRSEASPQAGERMIGFNLVDRARMLPALLVVEGARKHRLQQVHCR
jgi:hypothetical protein